MEEREWEERTENRTKTDAAGGGAAAEPCVPETGAGDEAGRRAWDVFAASGKIRDYLSYRSTAGDKWF